MYDNALRRTSNVIYGLKKLYGTRVTIVTPNRSYNYDTGSITNDPVTINVRRCIVLDGKEARDLLYGRSLDPAFTRSGDFDTDTRLFILDSKDLPKDFTFTMTTQISYRSEMYETVSFRELQDDYSWAIVGKRTQIS